MNYDLFKMKLLLLIAIYKLIDKMTNKHSTFLRNFNLYSVFASNIVTEKKFRQFTSNEFWKAYSSIILLCYKFGFIMLVFSLLKLYFAKKLLECWKLNASLIFSIISAQFSRFLAKSEHVDSLN